MLNIILIALLSNFVIGCVVVVVALIVLVVVIMRWRCSKYWKKVEKEQTKEQEEKLLQPGLGDYNFKHEHGSWDYNLYQSLMNDKVLIREVRVFDPKKEDKDKLIFASSLPFDFTGEDKRALIKVIPELIDASVLNSHELMLAKSPASNFSEFKKAILTHLFIYLNRRYVWMRQTTSISLHYIENDKLNCHMRYMTRDHVRLGILLGDIPGITNWLNIVGQMEEKGTHQFDIQKDQLTNWDDLLPKIQEVFRQYFTGGVEFIGPK